MNIKGSKKILIIILFLNFVILAVYFLLFFSIKNKNEKTSILLNEIKTQTIKEAEFKLIENNLKETEIDRKKINSYFIQEGEEGVVLFVEYIENMGKISGVNLDVKSISFKEFDSNKINSESQNIFENMKVSLVVEGEWSDVIYFLKLLESSLYSMSFDKVYLEKEEVENSFLWKGTFNLNIIKIGGDNK